MAGGLRIPAVLAALALALAPSPARADGADPPALPAGTDTCVGASPVLATRPSWAVARLAPQSVWPLSRGAGVVVAVVDTGVSAAAPALAGAVLPGTDIVGGGPADTDCRGHGTALAGLVAGRPVSGTTMVGLAPAATVLPIRITDAKGQIPASGLARGIRAATVGGATVILVGTGVTAPDPDLRAAVDDAVAHDIVVVAPVAGRGGGDAGAEQVVWYPAAFEPVLAVGGVSPQGQPTEASPARAGVDLVAPSGGAVTAGPVGDGHYSVGGPAVAAAFVAATAALVRAYFPTLSQAEVRRRLQLTAERPPAGARAASALGAGEVDPYAAVTAIAPQEVTAPVRDAAPGRVTLPHTLPAGRAGTVAALVATGVVAAAGIASATVATVIHGRRRRWHPR
jgi:membrane-anchored mycosin MYCP